MSRHPHELDQRDRAIVAAYNLLPPKDRHRPPDIDMLAHAVNWPRRVAFNAAEAAGKVAAADTIEDFDEAMTAALNASAASSATSVGPGIAFGNSLTAQLNTRRARALSDEAADLAEKLRPIVEKAQAELCAAAAELPKGAGTLDAEAILAADAGVPWRQAHDAIGVLLTVAGIASQRDAGDGEGRVRQDWLHLRPILTLLDLPATEPAVHDNRGTDRTAMVDGARAAMIASLHGFVAQTAGTAPGAILIAVAQNTWRGIALGFEPTGAVALAAIHNAHTSKMATQADIRAAQGHYQKPAVMR